MADKTSASANFPWTVLLSLLTAVGGVASFWPPLDSARPQIHTANTDQYLGYQDVESRLWQDPLQAVTYTAGPSAVSQPAHDPSTLEPQFRESNPAPRVLAVMLSGLPYAEDVEDRLRTRVAVASALGRIRYAPDDGVHLGYFSLPWVRVVAGPSTLLSESPATPPSQLLVPYEWWHPQTWRDPQAVKELSAAGSPAADNSERVLVLWLKEDAFQDRPFVRLATLLDALRTSLTQGPWNKAAPQITLIGPKRSSTLRAMLTEADAPDEALAASVGNLVKRVQILSPTATASDDILKFVLSDKNRDCNQPAENLVRDAIKLQGVRRTIATDDVLADSLLDELNRRHVDIGSDRIALIAERDTLYGRALPLTLAERVVTRTQGAASARDLIEHNKNWPKTIDRFSYLRGIDGQIPGDDPLKQLHNSGTKAALSTAGEGLDFSQWGQRPAAETEGRNQSDGLVRLAEQILDADAKYQQSDGSRFRAVGILGGDVYDKLLILKALRKRMPGVLFFTTDLDARYAHPAELNETRNLIIASPFGLRLSSDFINVKSDSSDGTLNQNLQGDIPPFRDSYQTSTFLTTLIAMGQTNVTPEAINSTRLFEIGRNGPVDISVSPSKSGLSIHPETPVHFARLRMKWSFDRLLCMLAVILMAYWLVCRYRGQPLRPWQWEPGWRLFVAALVILGTGFVYAAWAGSGPGGEPVTWSDGVSVWPSEAIRVLAACASLGFIISAQLTLLASENRIGAQFKLETRANHRSYSAKLDCSALWHRPWEAENALYHWTYAKGKPVDAAALWDEYLHHGHWARRLIRVGWLLLLLNAFMFLTQHALGIQSPPPPARGQISFLADTVAVSIAVELMFALTFWVGDTARLCRKLTRNLKASTTCWPSDLLKELAQQRGTAESQMHALVDVRFAALRTAAIMPLVYYPFIILFLMLAARSSYFDDWTWPPFLLISQLVNFIWAIYQYISLRRAAEELRSDSVQTLEKELFAVKENREQQERLSEMLNETRDERRGAFVSVFGNPLVGALLLPSAGLGAWVIVQYFLQ